MRRNFIRYILLSYVITLRKVNKDKLCNSNVVLNKLSVLLALVQRICCPLQISFRVRKRFPTLDHLIELGILQPEELKIMDTLNEKAQVKKWWMPLVWATQIVEKARR